MSELGSSRIAVAQLILGVPSQGLAGVSDFGDSEGWLAGRGDTGTADAH